MRSDRHASLRLVICSPLLTTFFSLSVLAASKQGTEGDTTLKAPSGLTVTNPAIKGDLPTGEYYLADCPEYDRVDPAIMLLFATEEEAQWMGFHKAENCP